VFVDSISRRDCFILSLQKLKKLLKNAAEEQQQAKAAQKKEEPGLFTAPSEKEFVETLQEDVKRINTYFMEQEEDAIIRLQTLRDRRAVLANNTLAGPQAEAEATNLHTAFVNLHGELILLFHYSMVNYAGVMKILKKHDKIMGAQQDRKKEYLHTLLQQPFTSTESISRLVKEAEEEIRTLSPSSSGEHDETTIKAALAGALAAAAAEDGKDEAAPAVADESILVKRTRAALNMLEQLQQTAHTPSTLLPTGNLPSDGAVPKRQKPTER
jgi:SPX domain protein involved in polyphosphate accumulation